MVRVALGLGANLGERKQTISGALEALDETRGLEPVRVSGFYETEPWGVADQPLFLNICALYDCTLDPRELLCACKEIEARIGRTASVRWGPREIDIDILTYGDHTCNEPDLSIPHINMLNREFVLAPLAEIAPDTLISGVSVKEHLEALRAREKSAVAPVRTV